MKDLGYWMGRPILELSRDELLEIIEHLSRQLDGYHTPEMVNALVIGKVAQVTGGRIPKSVLKGRL